FRLRPLMKPACLALFHFQMLRPNIAFRNNSVTRFNDSSCFPSKAVGDQRQRFFEACVPGFARFEQSPKFFWSQPAANLSLQWGASRRCIHHALDMNGSHFTTHTCHTERQKVHHKSGIHTGPNDARTILFADPIELRGQVWFAKLWKKELFAR